MIINTINIDNPNDDDNLWISLDYPRSEELGIIQSITISLCDVRAEMHHRDTEMISDEKIQDFRDALEMIPDCEYYYKRLLKVLEYYLDFDGVGCA